MAQASRKLKAQRRTKRKNSTSLRLTRKAFEKLHADYTRTYLTLLYVLAQNGGQISVTQGTCLQVMQRAAELKWSAQDNPDAPGEVLIRMIEPTPVPEVVESVIDPPEPREAIKFIETIGYHDYARRFDPTLAFDPNDPVLLDHAHDPTHPDLELERFAGEGNPHHE